MDKENIMVGYFTAEFLRAQNRSEYPGNYQALCLDRNPWDVEWDRLCERFPDQPKQIVEEMTVCEKELPDFALREEEVEQELVESSVAVTEDRTAKFERIRAKMAQKTDEYSPIKVVIQPPKQAPKRKVYRYPYKVPMSRRHGRGRR